MASTDRRESYEEKYDRMIGENAQRRQRGRLIIRAREAEVEHWQIRGHEGTYLVDPDHGFDTRTMRAHLGEFKPGTHGGMHRHTNEAIIRILKGRGYSYVDDQRVDWQEGDVLFIPTMAWHQHFNPDPEQGALYYAVTTVPLMQHLGWFRIEYPESVPETERPNHWEPI
jgi:gentisate 1,2-dioxygenase